MSTRFLLAAALGIALGASACALDGGPTVEHAWAPDALYHADIQTCAIHGDCDPLCEKLFELGPYADIQECRLLLVQADGARVRVSFYGDNGGWDDSVVYVWDDGDDGGYYDDGGDCTDDGSCDDGSTDSGDDGDGGDDGSMDDGGGDDGGGYGDDGGGDDGGGDDGGGDDGGDFSGGHHLGHGTTPDLPRGAIVRKIAK